MREVYAGVDVGSSSVRLGIMNECGELLRTEYEPIDYVQSALDARVITQSSAQIWSAYEKCMRRIKDFVGNDAIIKSIACAATCSMAVFRKEGKTLVPYPVDDGVTDEQNIIFWMDHRAFDEAKQINSSLAGNKILEYYGGAFLEEMGIPKVKHMISHTPSSDLHNLTFFALHDYLTYKIAEVGNAKIEQFETRSEVKHLAPDGDIRGWSAQFLRDIGLERLTEHDFEAIGGIRHFSNEQHFSSLPLAGTKIAVTKESTAVCQGVIDCYASWIASSGKMMKNTLTMVAGTSTCFLIGHNLNRTSPGVWGPYDSIIPDMLVSQVGQATTGKLIEHLLDTHPAARELDKCRVFAMMEDRITSIEQKIGKSIHYSTKHMFLYGDLSGNRSPYCDGSMRGAFIGESSDTSITDLVLKYICVLEFIALSTKQILSILKEHDIKKITICGSQAKNERLVRLLSLVTKLPIEISEENPNLAGVKGAAYLGLSGLKHIPLIQVVEQFNTSGILHRPETSSDAKLVRLLDKKFEIMLDMANSQRRYREIIDQAIKE